MSDTPTPGISDLMNAPAAPQLETTREAREAAFNVMQRLRADNDYREKYLRRDDATVKEVEAAHRLTTTPSRLEIRGRPAQEVASMIGSLENFTSLSPEVVAQLKTGEPVSAEEQKWARQQKSRRCSSQEAIAAQLCAPPATKAARMAWL
jgi:hypothetical protein